MNRPVFGQRTAYIERSKHELAVKKAVIAMRQLGIGVVKHCDICGKLPHGATENTFPCFHISLYDSSLRGYGLLVLNDAAREWSKESKVGRLYE